MLMVNRASEEVLSSSLRCIEPALPGLNVLSNPSTSAGVATLLPQHSKQHVHGGVVESSCDFYNGTIKLWLQNRDFQILFLRVNALLTEIKEGPFYLHLNLKHISSWETHNYFKSNCQIYNGDTFQPRARGSSFKYYSNSVVIYTCVICGEYNK